jgi:hypothetical protein
VQGALREGLADNVFTVVLDFAFAKVFDEIVNVAHDVLNLKSTKGHERRGDGFQICAVHRR